MIPASAYGIGGAIRLILRYDFSDNSEFLSLLVPVLFLEPGSLESVAIS